MYLPLEGRPTTLIGPEGIKDDNRRAFVVFLASHIRPICELLAPNRKNLKKAFADQFQGMALGTILLTALERTRERLIKQINKDLMNAEREFLLSMKPNDPSRNRPSNI